MYTLFQRDRSDAPEPMSMLFYDPRVSGDFWYNLPLDGYFSNPGNAWVSMRSSWTTDQGLFLAMKTGALLNHQTHGDLDSGDFVLDALGQRWAGELGNGNYLADGYFSSEGQNSARWLYYRKRTEGQNTLLLGGQNQDVNGVPTTAFDSTHDAQTSFTYVAQKLSTAYFKADLTSFYGTLVWTPMSFATLILAHPFLPLRRNVKRAIRMLNGRRQVLIQDEVNVLSSGVQWCVQLSGAFLVPKLTGLLSQADAHQRDDIPIPEQSRGHFDSGWPTLGCETPLAFIRPIRRRPTLSPCVGPRPPRRRRISRPIECPFECTHGHFGWTRTTDHSSSIQVSGLRSGKWAPPDDF